MFICVRLFKSTIQREREEVTARQRERERVRKKTNRRSERKGQKTNGVEGKTRPVAHAEREREIRWEGVEQVRKLDERSVRRPRSQSQHLIPKTAQRLGRNQPR